MVRHPEYGWIYLSFLLLFCENDFGIFGLVGSWSGSLFYKIMWDNRKEKKMMFNSKPHKTCSWERYKIISNNFSFSSVGTFIIRLVFCLRNVLHHKSKIERILCSSPVNFHSVLNPRGNRSKAEREEKKTQKWRKIKKMKLK